MYSGCCFWLRTCTVVWSDWGSVMGTRRQQSFERNCDALACSVSITQLCSLSFNLLKARKSDSIRGKEKKKHRPAHRSVQPATFWYLVLPSFSSPNSVSVTKQGDPVIKTHYKQIFALQLVLIQVMESWALRRLASKAAELKGNQHDILFHLRRHADVTIAWGNCLAVNLLFDIKALLHQSFLEGLKLFEIQVAPPITLAFYF